MSFMASPPRSAIIAVSGIISLLLLWRLVVTTNSPYAPSFGRSGYRSKHQDTNVQFHPQNGTLGFEKIFALNLPERSDKRDSLSLAASLTGVDITYIDGIKGQEVINKSLPFGQEERKFTEPMLGSWRAHMNAVRTVVEDRLSSALILEDDVDWDIRIKGLLQEFSEGSRWVQGYGPDNKTHSPYGDDWDLLWLGFCHDRFDKGVDGEPFIIANDLSTVNPEKMAINPSMRDFLHQWPDHTRVVHQVHSPICSYAYAISYKGAQKLLWGLSVKHLTGLFDNALATWCENKATGTKCLGGYPAYFYPHKARGGKGKNSDNNPKVGGREKSETPNIQWSARMNIENMLEGKMDFTDAYPDEKKQAIPPSKEETREGVKPAPKRRRSGAK